MQRLVICLVLGLLGTHASATPLTVGGFVFAGGEQSFADDAFLVSGTIRFTCATAAAGPAASVGAALTGSDLQQCANNNTGNSGIVEVLFLDNSLQNGAGADLAIFELSGALPSGTSDPRERFGVSIHNGTGFTPFVYFDPIATGTNSCGDPSLCLDTFVVLIDLSNFGISDGGVTTRLQLHIYDVGLGTKSADIGALGALNSGPAVPEPSGGVLLAAALATFVAIRRIR